MNLLLPIAVTAFALMAVNKGRAAQKLKFYFKNIDFSQMTLTNWKAIASLEVVNPTKVTQTVEAIFLTATLENGEVIGRIESNQKQTIGPLGSSILQLPLIIQPAGGASYLAKKIKGENPTVKISGVIHTMGVAVPYSQNL